MFGRRICALAALLLVVACGRTTEVTALDDAGSTDAADDAMDAEPVDVRVDPAIDAARDAPDEDAPLDAGCVGFVDVAVDNGAPEHFSSMCTGTWGSSESTTAVGYIVSGGPPPGAHTLGVAACTNQSSNTWAIGLVANDATQVGTFTNGYANFTDATGNWSPASAPFQVEITRLDPVGGVIEGTFSASVTRGEDLSHLLAGSFHVCHVHDEDVP